jgi:hypothetical protein
MKKQSIEEKMELVFSTYTDSLDLDIAFLKHAISRDEQKEMLNDSSFMRRIEIYDCMFQEELIVDLRNLAKTANSDAVRLSSIKELGQIFYKKKFNEKKNDNFTGLVPDKVVLAGADE